MMINVLVKVGETFNKGIWSIGIGTNGSCRGQIRSRPGHIKIITRKSVSFHGSKLTI